MSQINEEVTAFSDSDLPDHWNDEDVGWFGEFLVQHLDMELVEFVGVDEYDYAIQREKE